MRCLIEELSAAGKKPTKEELFTLLREKYPWLQSEKGVEYEVWPLSSYITVIFKLGLMFLADLTMANTNDRRMLL